MAAKQKGAGDPLGVDDYFSFSAEGDAKKRTLATVEASQGKEGSLSCSITDKLQKINLLGDGDFDIAPKVAAQEKRGVTDAIALQPAAVDKKTAPESVVLPLSESAEESTRDASAPIVGAPVVAGVATVTNLHDCQTDSDSDEDVLPAGGKSPMAKGKESGKVTQAEKGESISLSRKASGVIFPCAGNSIAGPEGFVADEVALLEAQKYLEKAEQESNVRDSSKKEDSQAENSARQSIVMKSRGTEEEAKVSSDPFVSGIFSLKNPRDATAGIISGVKSVSKGVALGVASLVVCPVIGAQHGGVGGFVKGVGAGVVGAVTASVAGVGIAGYQIGKGVINTPNAVCQKLNGKKWDKKECKWKDDWYSLEEETREVLNALKRREEAVANEVDVAAHSIAASSSHVNVADLEFYNVLGVSTSATQAEIKRQYYQLAKKYHPDKTKDASSAEKFKKLGEAYQVLGDEERRFMYDKHGKAACDEMPILDSSLLFTMLFGSDDLEPYIGKLRMALFLELEVNHRGKATTEADLELAQWDREVKVALNLRDMVRPYVCGDLEKWYAGLVDTGKKLCTSVFTTDIVYNIGWTYCNIANRYIGKWDTFLGIGGKVAKFQEQSKSFGKGVKTFTSLFKTAVAERSVQQLHSSVDAPGDVNEDELRDICEASLPSIMNVMLNICLIDIQSTVKGAAKRIIKDMGVDQQWRRKRAEGLGLMGRAFMVAAEDARKRMKAEGKPESIYDMFARAAQKAQQRENNSRSSYTSRQDDGFF